MESRKTKIISVVAIVALAFTVITATYAYFNAQGGSATSTNLNVTTYTTDVFTFAAGDEINLEITQSNFASGKGNAVGSTFASATLTANNKTNTATEHYYLYLNIENNDFEYTVNSATPELMLTITDSEGNEVTDIEGLTHTTVTDAKGATVSGYDITTKSGLLTIFKNREITTTSKKEEKWNINITFVNYDENQNANAGKSMSAKVMIQKEEEKVFLADYVKSLYTGTQGDNNIYYHDSSLTNGAGDSSYRYSGANPNNYVCFGSNESTCPTDNLYRIIGVFGNNVKLIKYDYGTTDELGTDGDYYQTYKEWGMDSTYKGTYGDGERIGVYYWNNTTQKNTWSESLLNKTNLNTNFINNIGEEWANKIAITTWKVGGNTYSNIYSKTPSVVYQNEIVNPVTTNTTDNATEYTAKIGLMYVSDYGFAAEPSAWTLTMGNYNNTTATSTNWMYMGLYEWTLSRFADFSGRAFRVDRVGYVYSNVVNYYNAVRPSFNLESSITYVSGSGSASDPMVIN